MDRKDIKKLYAVDRSLAIEVAKVLGLNIKIKGSFEKTAPSASKIKKDITDMLKKELNTMKLGKDLELWISQLPDFLE